MSPKSHFNSRLYRVIKNTIIKSWIQALNPFPGSLLHSYYYRETLKPRSILQELYAANSEVGGAREEMIEGDGQT